MCLLLNFKLAYSFKCVFDIEMFILNYIVSLILIDLYGLSYAYHIAKYVSFKEFYYTNKALNSWKRIYLRFISNIATFVIVLAS